MKAFVPGLLLTLIIGPGLVCGGTASYESAASKALASGRVNAQRSRPQSYGLNDRYYARPSAAVAALPETTTDRRSFSYEPATEETQPAALNIDQPYSRSAMPGRAAGRHAWQDATRKGLGRVD